MILITGGTGLVGSHLLLELIKSGKDIRAIKRFDSDTEMVRKIFSYYTSKPDEFFKKIDWVEADLLDFGAIDDAMDGITEVYHAGAVVSFYPKDHKAMLKVNIDGTANLINLSIEKKIRKLCYVSSIATLGKAENNGHSTEETYWKTARNHSVYSMSKYGAEREVWRGMEEGLPAVIVNPSVILGPGFWDDNSGFFNLVWKGLKYYTNGINGFVDVRDVVKAMIQVMEQEQFNERFIVSAENISYHQLFTLIAKYFGKPAPEIKVPSFATRIAWRVEAVRSKLTGSLPQITKEMANTTSQATFVSSEKIRQRMGFQFISVENSIRETCELFLKEISGNLTR